MIRFLNLSIIFLLFCAAVYPDKNLTPGAVDSACTVQNICTPGYTAKVRHVPQSLKRKVLESYGYDFTNHPPMEVDHLISLELCGSNDQKNLWPELYEPRPGAHEKDVVENKLHREICNGKISLENAQKIISEDWLKEYQNG